MVELSMDVIVSLITNGRQNVFSRFLLFNETMIIPLEVLLCSLTQELKWSLSPQTPISWLNVYMQVAYLKETDQLLIPRYPQTTFTQIAEVYFCLN